MKLENTIVIVSDLGELKAFEVKEHERNINTEVKTTYALALIDDENLLKEEKNYRSSKVMPMEDLIMKRLKSIM